MPDDVAKFPAIVNASINHVFYKAHKRAKNKYYRSPQNKLSILLGLLHCK